MPRNTDHDDPPIQSPAISMANWRVKSENLTKNDPPAKVQTTKIRSIRRDLPANMPSMIKMPGDTGFISKNIQKLKNPTYLVAPTTSQITRTGPPMLMNMALVMILLSVSATMIYTLKNSKLIQRLNDSKIVQKFKSFKLFTKRDRS